jgi:hypothetical protein
LWERSLLCQGIANYSKNAGALNFTSFWHSIDPKLLELLNSFVFVIAKYPKMLAL